jgi:hypothetical protein
MLIYNNPWISGTGQHMYVHDKTADCMELGCVVHNPTDPHADWPTHYDWKTGVMFRICPCGLFHPDKDDIAFRKRLHAAGWTQHSAGHMEDVPCACTKADEPDDYLASIARVLGLFSS